MILILISIFLSNCCHGYLLVLVVMVANTILSCTSWMYLFDGVVNSLSFVKVWKSLFIFQVWYCKKKKIVLINESVITIICINSLCYHSLILIWWLIQEFYIQKNSFKYNQTLHTATFIKRSPFSCPVMENFIWIEPLLRGHLTYKATFSLSQWWPLNTGLTVV